MRTEKLWGIWSEGCSLWLLAGDGLFSCNLLVAIPTAHIRIFSGLTLFPPFWSKYVVKGRKFYRFS